MTDRKYGTAWGSARFGLRLLTMLFASILAGCSDDDGGITDPTYDPDVYELVVVSGGGQSGLAGTVLPQPLSVQVRRIEGGIPEEGVTVRWRVTSGSAEPTRTTSATEQDGEATTRIVLGSAGQVRVQAEVSGLTPVVFAAITVLPAPSIASISPTSVDPGDEIEVRVNDLPPSVGAQVLFDGVEGTIVTRQPGSPAVLRTIVPAPAGVCGSTTQTVGVRVRADGVTTGSRSIQVGVPADPFQVGQVLVVEGTDDVQCALLPADGGAARYLLVALSAEFEEAGSFQVTLGGGDVAVSGGEAVPSPPAADFHTRLRAIEHRLAERGLSPAEPSGSAGLFAAPTLGDVRRFWVLNDIEATDNLTQDAFDRVTATLKYIGVHTLVFVDNAAPSSGLTQADIDFLGDTFDRRLYDADVDFFGEPTDVDGNDRVILLLSPTVNSLTPGGSEGVIIGFFFGLDLFPPNTAGCPECQFSNGAEIFYGLVPDPSGIFGDPRTRDRVLELLPGVTVHETQHMISFRYKVFENSPPGLETLWLSEALAHQAEELAGDIADADGLEDLANDLYAANFGRAARYLMDPEQFSLTATEGQGSLGERGAWWLFTRWLADQYGDFIFRPLTQAPENGVDNVTARTGESFFRLFADFSVAIWADDLEIPGLAERYQVPKWLLRSALQLEGSNDYILQPLSRTFSQMRGNTTVSRFITGSSAFYVELDAAGDTQPLQLELNATTNAGLAILRYE